MYHAYNVIKFLTGDIFQESTLIDDIKKTVDELKKGKDNVAIQKFRSAFTIYVQKMQQEAIRFATILMYDGFPYEYQDIKQRYFMPFRFSKNPIADKLLFQTMFEMEEVKIDQLIIGLIGNYNYEYFNGNQIFLDRMNYFFNYDPIAFEDIGKRQRVGWIERIPLSGDVIVNEFNETMNKTNGVKNSKKIGNYGEYLFYQYLLNNYDYSKEVMWISRDLGDGFGYDIAVYDRIENRIILYEVKTTTNEESFNNTDLDDYESRICNNYRDRDDTEYHVIKILVGSELRMIDIDDKNETVTDLLENKNNYKVLRKTNSVLNNYMIIKN